MTPDPGPTDIVFRHIHRQWVRDEEILPNAFKPYVDPSTSVSSISTLWERFISAENALREKRNIEDNGIASLLVRRILSYEFLKLEVRHTPDEGHPSHCSICNAGPCNLESIPEEDVNEIKVFLSRIAQWVIRLGHNIRRS